jgi:hypothetical protein
MKNLIYKDTRNYSPIDVTKGVDLLTGKIVMADNVAPENYELRPKCKFCQNYKEENEFNGECEASMSDPKFFAYGDMDSVTCGMYKQIN